MNKLIIGFAAGLLTGILFAPSKGSETRERIARRGRELKDKFSDMVDAISDRFDSFESDVDDFAERTKQRARSAYTSGVENS